MESLINEDLISKDMIDDYLMDITTKSNDLE